MTSVLQDTVVNEEPTVDQKELLQFLLRPFRVLKIGDPTMQNQSSCLTHLGLEWLVSVDAVRTAYAAQADGWKNFKRIILSELKVRCLPWCLQSL